MVSVDQEHPPPPGIQRLGPFRVPRIGLRHVRVVAPPGPVASGARGTGSSEGDRPVLYLFDGQNVFDDAPSFSGGWHLHEIAAGLAAHGLPVPVLVGIEHGGDRRMHELVPFRVGQSEGLCDYLVEWALDRLAPKLVDRFGVSTRPERVVFGGSSLGGLAALYAHFRWPGRIGGVMAMSPSLWVGRGRFFRFCASRANPIPSRIYLDAGAREDGGAVVSDARRLDEHLRGRGWDHGDRLRFVVDPDGGHDEPSWRRRAPDALRWLVAPMAAVPEHAETEPEVMPEPEAAAA